MLDKQNKFDEQRKILSILSHLSILFSSTIIAVCIPIALILLSEDDVVIGNAKEAINFYITACFFAVCFFVLAFLFIGFPLLILLIFATVVMPIIAISKISHNPNRVYRYPLIFHIL